MGAELLRATTAALLSGVLVAACSTPAETPAEGHLVVTVDTDAPLPSSAGSTVGVFDSLHLEVLGPDGRPACDDCVRELALTREDVDRGASFVVRTTHPALLRARLFSSRLGVASLDDAVVIQRWVALPAAPEEGARELTVTLPFDRVGLLLDSLAEPSAPDEPGTRLPRPPAEPASAGGAEGEVCVAGGWFWMGDPRLPPEGERSANVPRLVHVTSFCVDDHEVTVAELRAARVDTADVVKWSGHRSTSTLASFCAFTDAPGPNDERGVNCVPWATARAACEARGMDLPTEAQLEWLGTNFGRSRFVWGQEVPACDAALLARSVPPLQGDGSCARGARDSTLPATASEVSATRDVLRTPGGPVFGLASNLSEWTRESFEPATAACRMPGPGPARDPECPTSRSTTRVAVRGGNLTSAPVDAAAAVRAFVMLPLHRADLGFRCVR